MIFKSYSDVFNLLGVKERDELKTNIDFILKNAWGEFPNDFIENHILRSSQIILAVEDDKSVGFCCLSDKKILGKNIIYIEFLVVKKEFQNKNIGSKLVYHLLKKYILKNILSMVFHGPLEIMFITPNIRILTWMARLADFIYPNPYFSDESGSIPIADKNTWEMASELVKMSDNPTRKLNREGLVLENSYASAPWLIYKDKEIPWHHLERFNKFSVKYLGYGNEEDKEFVVRAQIGFLSILKYFLTKV